MKEAFDDTPDILVSEEEKQHDEKDKEGEDHPLHPLDADLAPEDLFVERKADVPSIENRDWEKVQQGEVEAEEAEEIDRLAKAHRKAVVNHLDDSDRATHHPNA